MSGFATAGTGSEGVLNAVSHSGIDHTGILGVGSGGGDAFPIGCMVPFGALVSAIPAGWLACDGSEYGRTGGDPSPQPTLFGIIGTAWGIGDGSTTFNVPDLRHRGVAGINDGTLPAGPDGGFTTRSLGQLAGSETHSHTVNNHSHTISSDGAHTHTGTTDPNGVNIIESLAPTYPGNDGINSRHTHTFTTGGASPSTHSHGSVTGQSNPSTNAQPGFGPTAFCPFIIKAVAVGGGAGGISNQVNAGPLQGPQPTINYIEGPGISITAVENIPQNRNDVTINATGAFATLPFGCTFVTPNNYAVAHGDGAQTEIGSLTVITQTASPIAGGTVTLSWNVSFSGGDARVFVNGVAAGTPVTLSTANGASAQAIAVAAGDRIAVEYQTGTAPGPALFEVHVGP